MTHVDHSEHKKSPTWEIDFIRFVDRVRARPFAWGLWDCCQMCGQAVEAQTGHNPVAGIFGPYDSKKAALRAIRIKGSANLLDTLRRVLGPALPIHTATRGDVVYTVQHDGPAIGMCIGEQSVFVDTDGLIEYPTLDLTRAFKIG